MHALELRSLRGTTRHETALVYGDVAFTGEMLDAEADRLAAYLASQGLGSRHRVAMLLGTTPAFVVCMLALVKLGASSVLLGTRLTEAEVVDIVRRTETTAILAPPIATSNRSVPATLDAGTALDLDPRLEPVALWRTSYPAPAAEAGELFLQLTSGVSGRSKIVPRSAANVLHELEQFAARLGFAAREATVCPCPLSHAYGLVNGFLLPFYSGRPTILLDFFVPSALVDAIKQHRPRVLVGVPAMYEALSRIYDAAASDLSSLSICFSAGAPFSETLARAFRDRYHVPIRQQYGSTETGVIAINDAGDAAPDPQVAGRPVQTREIAIVRETGSGTDEGNGGDVGEGGEIVVRSKGSATCYVDDPALSARRFRDGWYFTGDLGTVDADGVLRLHGRRTAFINVGGLKVHPLEVEEVLGRLDGVVECAVVAAHDRFGGEVVKAIVVTKRRRTAADVRKFCRERLAPHKVPRHVTFLDALPRSASGKVLTKYLVDA